MKRLFECLILINLLIIGCGRHDVKNSYREQVGEQKHGEKLTDPDELAAAAIFDSNLESLTQLLNEGFDVNHVLKKTERTLLAEAIFSEKLKVIRLLIARGASLDRAVIENLPAIEWVEKNEANKGKMKRAIFKTEIDDQKDLFLVLVINKNREVQALLEEGISSNLFNEEGETALTFCIKRKALLSVRGLFQDRSLDVNMRNKMNESPWQLAKKQNLKALLDELKKRGAKEDE